jgi:transposase-like protein
LYTDNEHFGNFFEELKSKNLKGVELIISDEHKGIISAAEKAFPGLSWQMRNVHFIRNVMKKVPNKPWKEITERLKQHLTSIEELQIFIEELEQEGFEKAGQTCERFI